MTQDRQCRNCRAEKSPAWYCVPDRHCR